MQDAATDALAAGTGEDAGSAGSPEEASFQAAAESADAASVEPGSEQARAAVDKSYRLGAGDRLRLIVFGEQDLSGEFEVDATGGVAVPLIGLVPAQGNTVREFETKVATRLADGYLTSPKVSVEVLSYRPFYIIGEVQNGGEYPYVAGMHVLNAVAMAGGYTYRANKSRVLISRSGEEEERFPADTQTEIMPGDVIRVPERFF